MAVNVDYFVDIFDDVVSNVRAEYDAVEGLRPFYMYGHPVEIASRLALKDQSAIDKFNKFPLVILVTDLKQVHGEKHDIAYKLDPFTVLIVYNTDKNYISEDRKINTFEPILYPIYNLLIKKIQESNYIKTSFDLVEHDHYDRYYWGSEGIYGNEGLIFNEYLDAIELTFTNIEVYKETKGCH